MSTSELHDAIAGLGDILAAGRVDIIFASAIGLHGIVGVAHETLEDGTDTEVAVVHAGNYEQAQIAMYEDLVEVGYEAVSV